MNLKFIIKIIMYYLLFGIPFVLISAHVDVVQFGTYPYIQYLEICGFEYLIFGCGIVLGLIIAYKKEEIK